MTSAAQLYVVLLTSKNNLTGVCLITFEII